MRQLFLVLLVTILATIAANAIGGEIVRSRAQVNLFKRTHICPSTGTKLKSHESCTGYVVDHKIALCDGGPDLASNMQYQTIAAGKKKDRTECKKGASAPK